MMKSPSSCTMQYANVLEGCEGNIWLINSNFKRSFLCCFKISILAVIVHHLILAVTFLNDYMGDLGVFVGNCVVFFGNSFVALNQSDCIFVETDTQI